MRPVVKQAAVKEQLCEIQKNGNVFSFAKQLVKANGLKDQMDIICSIDGSPIMVHLTSGCEAYIKRRTASYLGLKPHQEVSVVLN
jgi:hypothetical protein